MWEIARFSTRRSLRDSMGQCSGQPLGAWEATTGAQDKQQAQADWGNSTGMALASTQD
jgi:hypothetical protein